MDYKKLYEDLSMEYVAVMSANSILREGLTKAQERILYLEEKLEKYESLDDLLEEME